MRKQTALSLLRARQLVIVALAGTAWLQGFGPALAHTPCDDRPVLVADVQVEGNTDISTERIRRMIRTAPGQEFDPDVVDADVETLRASGLFSDVDVVCSRVTGEDDAEAKDIVVRFVVQEHGQIGGRLVLADDFPKMLEALGELAARDRAMRKAAGPQVRVRKIRFEGSSLFRDRHQAWREIMWKRPGPDVGIVYGSVLDAALVEDVETSVVAYCFHNGYSDAKVSVEKRFSPDGRWVDLIYHVREGPRYRVTEVVVAGLPPDLEKRAQAMIRLKAGDFYDRDKASQTEWNLRNFGRSRGYMHCDVHQAHYYLPSGEFKLVFEMKAD